MFKIVNSNRILILVIIFGAFLRFFRLNELMPFIGDQGWFYLSARDMVLTGNIPLVGITASHTWLHQGPLWTYFLAVILWLSKFNPVSGAYFTAFFGVITIGVIYKTVSSLFSKKTGVISALLYASSPLIVIHSRIPYHTSLIPFFAVLFIHFFYKWIKGDYKVFPFLVFILAILYNLELATIIFWFILAFFLVFGLIKKKKWSVSLFNKKIFFLSLILFSLIMFPIFIYDFQNGFPQTLKFAFWFPYRFFNIFINHSTEVSSISIFSFFGEYIRRLIFLNSFLISYFIFSASSIYLIYHVIKSKDLAYSMIALFLFVPLLSILINKTPSEAYLPIMFPSLIITVAIFLTQIYNFSKVSFYIILAVIVVSNFLSLLSQNYLIDNYGFPLSKRIETVKVIIEKSNGKAYNIIGKGEGSQFDSFTMDYEYIAWWLGKAPSKSPKKLKFVIEEKNKIIVSKFEK